MRSSTYSKTLPILLLGTLLGCGAEVGDSCTSNIECSPTGERICDISQLDGYCTVEGCDIDTCPEEAVCVRFFPTAFLSVPCDPKREDAVDPAVSATDHCTSDEICLTGGYCALRTQERRFCMKSCESDGDCRDGYECRKTGTRGAEAVPDPENPGIRVLRFCAQGL
jgi:hypothetical protein